MTKKKLAACVAAALTFSASSFVGAQSQEQQVAAYYERGMNAYYSGNYQQAIQILSSIAQKANSTDVYVAIGDSYRELGRPGDSISYLEHAYEMGDRSLKTLAGLGYNYMDVGSPENAVGWLQRAGNAYPDEPDVFWNLGLSCNDLGDNRCVVGAMDRVIGLIPSKSDQPYLYAGIAAYDGGDILLGLKYFLAGCDVFPNSSPLHFMAGKVFFDDGNYSDAIPYLKEAAIIEPGYMDSLYYLGFSYFNLGALDDSDVVCGEMMKYDKDDDRTVDICNAVVQKRTELMMQEQMLQQPMDQTMEDSMRNQEMASEQMWQAGMMNNF